ncbi:MAG: DUF2961 domain-containing protein [Clostridia bacterium]|nr:DUF2961 domain-containing protein [Clostridia bacterium]
MIYGNSALLDLKSIPLNKGYSRIHYEGSIDKAGRNADWDWHLFEDEKHKGEWVLFDAEGPGCILNFTQHRYPTSREPTFRFYFEEETEPRFEIKHSEFGEKYPFIEPVASRYIGPVDNGRGPIRVVRSFVPMPFKRHCRVTSDVYLEDFDRSRGGGGWGHVIWQSYPDGFCAVESFDPKQDITPVIDIWKKTGSTDLIPFRNARISTVCVSLRPGEEKSLFSIDGSWLVAGIRLFLKDFSPELLSVISVSAFFNRSFSPQICSPLGAFFGNELGIHDTKTLMSGLMTDGMMYFNWPMPFEDGCRIVLKNSGDKTVEMPLFSVRYTDEYNDYYASNPYGVLHTSEYTPIKHTPGADSIIGVVKGCGHMVSAVITAHGLSPDIASCEGNVRVHIDGCRTPSVDSDGSESYTSYGWGFPTPSESNPASCYDGTTDYMYWCEKRDCISDPYFFGGSLRFGIESGEFNNRKMEHSGILFWYGDETVKAELLKDFRGNIPVCESYAPVSVTSVFESDDDGNPETFTGCTGCTLEFDLPVPDGTGMIVLRRVADQTEGRQYAEVCIDGTVVKEYGWYMPDSNSVRKLYEDEFVIPSKYTVGKKEIKITVRPTDKYGNGNFSVLDLKVFGYR